jgi:hypothetical protein
LLLRCSGWSLGFASAASAGSAALIFSRATHSIANASDVGRLSRSYVHLKIHTHTSKWSPNRLFPPWANYTSKWKGGRGVVFHY